MLIEVIDPLDSGLELGRLYRMTRLDVYKGDDPGADNGSCRWLMYRPCEGKGLGSLNMNWHDLELVDTSPTKDGAEEYSEIMRVQELWPDR